MNCKLYQVFLIFYFSSLRGLSSAPNATESLPNTFAQFANTSRELMTTRITVRNVAYAGEINLKILYLHRFMK